MLADWTIGPLGHDVSTQAKKKLPLSGRLIKISGSQPLLDLTYCFVDMWLIVLEEEASILTGSNHSWCSMPFLDKLCLLQNVLSYHSVCLQQ